MNKTSTNDNRCKILNDLNELQDIHKSGMFAQLNFDDYHFSKTYQDMCQFILTHQNCFLRNNTAGHVTGSALVVNSNFDHVLFTFHAKLKRWLQLGGHCDGDHLVQRVALKEAQEESGLENLKFVNFLDFHSEIQDPYSDTVIPFDIDIHKIPARTNEPAHYHFDIRYLLMAVGNHNIEISDESLDLKWIHIDEVENHTTEPSVLRQIKKLKLVLRHSHSLFNNRITNRYESSCIRS